MTVLAPPPRDELEALIREARERQRRRRIVATATVAVLGAAGLVGYALVARDGSQGRGRPQGQLAGLPRCHSNQLRLSVPPAWGAAAGTMYEPATLTNTSGSSCTVAGWPALRRLDATGQRIPVRLERWVYRLRGSAPYSVVTLAPGKTATFDIFGSDWNHRFDRACREARTIEVMPRGGGGWLSVTAASAEGQRVIPACRLWLLGPLVAGRVANPPPYAYALWKRSRRT